MSRKPFGIQSLAAFSVFKQREYVVAGTFGKTVTGISPLSIHGREILVG